MTENPGRPPLGMSLRAAHRYAARAFQAELTPLGLENRLAGVLLFLGRYGPRSQRELIDGIGSDKSSMVRDIDELEARGLARRAPHPSDRRAHSVEVTARGHAMIARLDSVVASVEDRLLEGFGAQDRTLFLELLDRFNRHALPAAPAEPDLPPVIPPGPAAAGSRPRTARRA